MAYLPVTGAASSVVNSNLTASRALASNASGKIVISATTDTELGFLSGVTSAIQTQLGSKLALAGGTMTGSIVFSTGQAIQTNTTATNTLLFQAYNTTGSSYTTFGTLTAGLTPTFDLNDNTTKAGQYIYRTSGTDVPVADGGTGVSSLTAYAPVFGGTTSTGAVQSGTVGTADQLLTSNGAGALPTFKISANYFSFGGGKSGNQATGYMQNAATSGAFNLSEYVVPFDATIIKITAACQTASNEWLIAVRKALNATAITSLVVLSSETSKVSGDLSVNVTAGDTLSLHLTRGPGGDGSAPSIPSPSVTVIMKRR